MAPENSLEALVLATGIEGCDGVEFDVRLSRDGVPVLLHDESLARVQGRATLVGEVDAAELRTMGVPSLAEVLEALPAEVFLDIELKGPGHGSATIEALAAGRGRSPERAVISSFEPRTLAAVRRRLPGWVTWLNSDDLSPAVLASAAELGCRVVSCHWRAVTPARLRAARGAGLEVAAWTVRQAKTFDRLGRLGVVACCVEGPTLDG